MHTIKPLTVVEGIGIDKSFMTYLFLMGQKGSIDGYIWYIQGPKEKIIVDTGIRAGVMKIPHIGGVFPSPIPSIFVPLLFREHSSFLTEGNRCFGVSSHRNPFARSISA